MLRSAVSYNDSELVKAIHSSILKFEEDIRLCNALISAYVKVGRIESAYRVFSCLFFPDVVSYTAMISGFAKSNRIGEAFELFWGMRDAGINPNEFTFVTTLTACGRFPDLEAGFQLHALAVKMGYLQCALVGNALMGMYGKFGGLDFVLEVFDEMPERDIASWNTVISCLVKELMYDRAFGLFRDMLRSDGFRVDHFTISTLLAASLGCSSWVTGKELHAYALKNGFESDLSINNSLLGFYKSCGSVENVMNLFERMGAKDVITWTEMITTYMESGLVNFAEEAFVKMVDKNSTTFNSMLTGYCRNGEGVKALALFCKMVEDGIELTEFSLCSASHACALITDSNISRQIHGFILKFGHGENEFIESALLDMYTRCGRMDIAEKMFYEGLGRQNCPIMWTSMVCAYSRNVEPEKAISLFYESQLRGVSVDEDMLAAVLGVCGTLGFHELGERIHCLALKTSFLSDIGTGNAIVSMYSKCGNIKNAIQVFRTMPVRDLVSWNSLIAGHVLHRQGDKAIDVWSDMQKEGMMPDSFTFLLLITAHRHTQFNLFDQCRKLFFLMETTYGIIPTQDHYASFVGVMGSWGLFDEVEDLINRMPFEPEGSVWRALLDTCRLRLNTRLGKLAARKVLSSDPHDPSTYILVSNLYSALGRWQRSNEVRTEMREKGLRKLPSRSWTIQQNKVHSFFSRDKSHSQSKDIYNGLDILILECMKVGYVPDTSFVLQEVEEHQKNEFLFYHSAKLAATFQLLTAKPGKIVRVMKNVVLCGDCHTFLKYVSIVTKREIHLRDTSGFHCFINGQCSCRL